MALKFLLLAFIASVCMGVGSSVKIDITPKEVKSTEAKEVIIKCTAEGTKTKSAVYLEVTKDNQTVAIVTECADMNCARSSKDVDSIGKIVNRDPSKSYLNIKIPKPNGEHAGEYECTFSFVDDTGNLKDEKAKDTLKVEEMKPSEVEQTLADLKAKVDKLEKECCKKGSGPVVPPPQPPKEDIKMAAFSVTNNREYRAVRNTKLVLPDVIMNEGPGYQKSTGVFVAPWRGLYAFHMTIAMASKASSSILQVKHNNNVLFRLYAGDLSYDDQTAGSSVAFLEKGDQVYGFVEGISGKANLYDNNRYTVFSGYLIKAME